MSETAPRSESPFAKKLETFNEDASQAWIDDLTAAKEGEESVRPYSDEHRRQLEEADAYYKHMEEMSRRDEGEPAHDDFSLAAIKAREKKARDFADFDAKHPTSNAFNREWDDAIAENEAFDERVKEEQARKEAADKALEAKFAADSKLRHMDMISEQLHRLRQENDEATVGRRADLEDRLEELLAKYADSDDYDPAIAEVLRDRTDMNALDEAAMNALSRSEADKKKEDEAEHEAVHEAVNAAKTAEELNVVLKANPHLLDDYRVRMKLDELRNGVAKPFGAEKDVVVANPDEKKGEKDDEPTSDDELRKELEKGDGEFKKDDLGEASDDSEEALRAALKEGFSDKEAPFAYDVIEDDEPVPGEDEDEKEDEPEKKGRFSWAKRAYARAGVLFAGAKEKFMGMDRDKKIAAGIGGVVLLGLATYAAIKLGHHDHHHSTGSGSGGGQTPENPAADMKADYDAKRHAADLANNPFSPEALKVDAGEGWLSELHQMGISHDEAEKLLPKILDSKDRGLRAWTYLMGDGNPGLSHPGKIPPSVLESIQELRNQ